MKQMCSPPGAADAAARPPITALADNRRTHHHNAAAIGAAPAVRTAMETRAATACDLNHIGAAT